jgi:hypothetical protein
MKIPHRPSMLTNHLADMRNYMPTEYRHVIEAVEAMPSIREQADRQAYNAVLDAMAVGVTASERSPFRPEALDDRLRSALARFPR